jgi:type IV pilus assembly protein PilN
MIRINLLAVDRPVAGKSKKAAAAPGVTTAQRVTIAAALILLSTVVSVGWWYWSLQTQSRQLDEDIARAEVEARQLRSVLAQVQKFETEKARLQQRVTLIEQLRRGQTGPVHILDEVSKSLPERLWLVSMGQRDKVFTIEGRTTSLTVLSDFVANLESSAWFTRPVEILDTAVDQTPTGDIVRFSVRATTQNPEAPAAPAAPAGRGAPPAR